MPAKAGIQSKELGPAFAGTTGNGLRSHPRFLERRNARRKLVQPFHQARMAGAPFSLEAQIAVAERAGERDLPDIRDRIERRRRCFKHIERALHLAALMVDPLRLVLFGRTPAALVDEPNAGIENAV